MLKTLTSIKHELLSMALNSLVAEVEICVEGQIRGKICQELCTQLAFLCAFNKKHLKFKFVCSHYNYHIYQKL